jgi:hypothetical protein
MEELEHQKHQLKLNLENLKSRSNENQLLQKTLKDYEFFESRVREKEQQVQHEAKKSEEHMQFILAYINNIMETNNLTETGINKLEYENRSIINLLDKVKEKVAGI